MLTPDLLSRLRVIFSAVFQGDATERRGIIGTALYGSPVVDQIEYGGPSSVFIPNLILKLDAFGSVRSGVPALVALLEDIRPLNNDRQPEIDSLIAALRPATAPATTPATSTTAATSSVTTPITIGTAAASATPPLVFVSYSHRNAKYLEPMKISIKPLEREGRLALWTDHKIQVSQTWNKEIDTAMQSSKAAILLISRDFIASDFIIKNELPAILKAREEGRVQVFPVLLSECNWERYLPELREIQFANPSMIPLDTLTKVKQEVFWEEIATALDKLLPPKNP